MARNIRILRFTSSNVDFCRTIHKVCDLRNSADEFENAKYNVFHNEEIVINREMSNRI